MSRKHVAVIGSGPAGLFAALAAINDGAQVTVFTPQWSKPVTPPGVFVLHHDVGLPLPPALIRVDRHGGTARDYAEKVYGNPNHPTSWTNVHSSVWDGARAISMAWDILKGAVDVVEQSCNLSDLHGMAKSGEYALVVSTAPLTSLDLMFAQLPYANIWAYTGVAPNDECYILYHANPNVPWYRASAAFGRFTLEFANDTSAHVYLGEAATPIKAKKVMAAPELKLPTHPRLLFTGRQGAWDKNKLSHHGYCDTRQALRML